MTSMKPPNILVFGKECRKWKDKLEGIVNTELFLVYTTTRKELEASVWIDNCRLLWLSPDDPKEWSKVLQRNVKEFVDKGGSVVSLQDSIGIQAGLRFDVMRNTDDQSIADYLETKKISCDRTTCVFSKTEGYLISDKRIDSFLNGKILNDEEYRVSDEEPSDGVTPIRLRWPDKKLFNVEEYFQFLRTREIGRTMLFTEHVSTTVDSIKTIDSLNGAVAIASRQLKPVARGRNSWISPQGCAMFSIALQFNNTSKLSDKLSFLQHIAALSVVRGIRHVHPLLEVGIKWPNDIYYRREAKIGGILSTCTLSQTGFKCYLGCGINVSNNKPLTCIQELARSSELSIERMIANMLTELECLLDLYERDPQRVLDEYHSYWLHSGEKVYVEAVAEHAIIQSVDHFGFLLAKKANGEIIRLQPDGNSYDLMKNLISTK